MRRSGLSLRAIAEALRCSLPEIHRLLKACVRGSRGLSDFKGVVVPSVPSSSRVTQSDDQKELRLSFTGDALASAPSAGNAGAIVAAIVSEYAASAHSAQLESDVTYDGRGALGEPTSRRVRSRIFNAGSERSSQRAVIVNDLRNGVFPKTRFLMASLCGVDRYRC